MKTSETNIFRTFVNNGEALVISLSAFSLSPQRQKYSDHILDDAIYVNNYSNLINCHEGYNFYANKSYLAETTFSHLFYILN